MLNPVTPRRISLRYEVLRVKPANREEQTRVFRLMVFEAKLVGEGAGGLCGRSG